MIFNHLSKCLNLCNLRHNRLRPVELLVFLELIKVFFQTLLRFHKFQVCSIFKVLRCCPLAEQLVYYISFISVCQEEIWSFLKNFSEVSSQALCRATAWLYYHIRTAVSIPFFNFFRADFQAAPLPKQWRYFTTQKGRRQEVSVQKSHFWQLAQFDSGFLAFLTAGCGGLVQTVIRDCTCCKTSLSGQLLTHPF